MTSRLPVPVLRKWSRQPASSISFHRSHRRISSPHRRRCPDQLLSNGRYAVMVTSARAPDTAGAETFRSPDGARMRPATHGEATFFCAILVLATSGRPVSNRAVSSLKATKWASRRIVWKSYETMELRPRRSRLLSLPNTMVRCAECPSATMAVEAREIELTSYAEIVLAPPADDAAHPAFSKMFVQTEFVASESTLLATRRRRLKERARDLGRAPRGGGRRSAG